MSKVITKYLTQYAECEVEALEGFPQKYFQYVVVVPAYKEKSSFIQRFVDSKLASENVLFIVVINQPDEQLDSTPQEQLYQQCLQMGVKRWQNQNIALIDLANTSSSLLVVDRFNIPIAIKQGVGLARKIGSDLALSLIYRQHIKYPWIFSTDADAHLPDNYFSSIKTLSSQVLLAFFNFDHYSDDPRVHQANQLYQQALRYYVAGLTYAGSKYAFYTIGSILAFHANAYAMVRGFPKRSAGEDFYLINKIAKLGQTTTINNVCIQLDARISDRVPFGTGPAVSAILSLAEQNKTYHYYHPQVFTLLKNTLTNFASLWEHRKQLDVWLDKEPIMVQESLLSIGFTAFVEKQKEATEPQFIKQLQVWFDAFKTLKFIHALRDAGLADIPLLQAIQQADFTVD